MATKIHPTAVVDPGAELGDGVVVGPYAIIGPGVVVGDGTEIGAGAQIQGPTRMGRENHVYPQAAVGFDPQDLKWQGEETLLTVGDGNRFREFSTVHRGTGLGGGLTSIGSDCLFMAYSHVAHDCHVRDRVILANSATLAGHVEVEQDAILGGFAAVQQFSRVGRHAYIGGFTVVTLDALPFVKTVGQKATCYGLNVVGLRRRGFSRERIRRLQEATRILLQSGLKTREALDRIVEELGGHEEIDQLVAFVEASKRGYVKTLPGRRGERGAVERGDRCERAGRIEGPEAADGSADAAQEAGEEEDEAPAGDPGGTHTGSGIEDEVEITLRSAGESGGGSGKESSR